MEKHRKAWVNGVYDPSLVGSYDWASHGKQTGITHEHTLNASGGSDKFKAMPHSVIWIRKVHNQGKHMNVIR